MGALLVVGTVVGLIWADDSSNKTPGTRRTNAVAATAQDLSDLAKRVNRPIYWAGPMVGETYELTRTTDGRIYIRYLPAGVDLGDPNPQYTTVGTYPDTNAYTILTRSTKRAGAKSYNTKSGALVVTNATSPRSVYFAFKGAPYLVEVFDPSGPKALRLVLSGQIGLIR